MALVLALRGWKPWPIAAAALIFASAWNLSPIAYNLAHSDSDPSAARAFWRPTIGFLHHMFTPDYRVEVVDTVDHWEAAYLPRAGIPIARGWFRQNDFPQNELLYDRFTCFELSLGEAWASSYEDRSIWSFQGAAVHFFLDDYRFETVWSRPRKALQALQNAGIKIIDAPPDVISSFAPGSTAHSFEFSSRWIQRPLGR